MEINMSRTEKIIAVSTVAVIGVFFVLFLKVNHEPRGPMSHFENENNIDYKMARPEEAYSEYSLNGRETDRIYEGLDENGNKKPVSAKNELTIKDKEKKAALEAKKKEETKKKQLATAKNQAVRLQQAQAAKARQAEQAAARGKSENVPASNSPYINDNYYAYTPNQPAAADAVPDAKPEAKAAEKKNFSDWTKLLLSNPTTENLAAFLAAFRKGDVTQAEYQALAQDLLKQRDSKFKALGLMALRSNPSVESLTQLAHLDPAQMGNYQSYVEQSVNAYLLAPNIGFLNQALASSDKVVLLRALNLLNVNLPKLNQGDFSSLIDPRNKRDGEVVTFSMATYRSLMPALTQLERSQDQELSGLAHQVFTLIQSSNNVAQN